MDFDTFEQHSGAQGDALKASDATDRPLIVQVTERREGIVTKFQPAGAPGVIVNVADINADQAYVGILWMNGAIVDNLSPYVGKTVPVRLVYQKGKNSSNAYITVEALTGGDLQKATAWGQANPNRFEQRRAEITAQAQAGAAASGATGNMAQVAQTTAPAPADGQSDVAALLAQLQAAQAK